MALSSRRTTAPDPTHIGLSCAWQSAERPQSYTSTSLGQFRYCRCLQKEISVIGAYAHFGAMQQTEQTYGDVGGQTQPGLPEECPAGNSP
jgi:hypothetical protein